MSLLRLAMAFLQEIRDTHEMTGTQEVVTLGYLDETSNPEPRLVDPEPADAVSTQELPLLPGDDRSIVLITRLPNL